MHKREDRNMQNAIRAKKHLTRIRLFLDAEVCSEQWESVGTKGKQALAQAIFHAGMATVFWKHQTTLQWIQTQPRLRHELQSKFLESDRLLSSVHRSPAQVDANCCTPLQASHVLKSWLSQGAAIHHGRQAQPFGLVGTVNTNPL